MRVICLAVALGLASLGAYSLTVSQRANAQFAGADRTVNAGEAAWKNRRAEKGRDWGRRKTRPAIYRPHKRSYRQNKVRRRTHTWRAESRRLHHQNKCPIRSLQRRPRCGKPAAEVDHVIPRVRGGNNSLRNAQPLCRSCNASKGSKNFPKNYSTTKKVTWFLKRMFGRF